MPHEIHASSSLRFLFRGQAPEEEGCGEARQADALDGKPYDFLFGLLEFVLPVYL